MALRLGFPEARGAATFRRSVDAACPDTSPEPRRNSGGSGRAGWNVPGARRHHPARRLVGQAASLLGHRSRARRWCGRAPQAILMSGLAHGLEKPYSVSDTCQSVGAQPDCTWAANVPVTVTAHDLLDSPSPYVPTQGDTDATLTTRLSRAAARGPHQGGDRRRIRRPGARAGL